MDTAHGRQHLYSFSGRPLALRKVLGLAIPFFVDTAHGRQHLRPSGRPQESTRRKENYPCLLKVTLVHPDKCSRLSKLPSVRTLRS